MSVTITVLYELTYLLILQTDSQYCCSRGPLHEQYRSER